MTTQPNRRTALKSVAALAAGLFAAPAVVKAPRPKPARPAETDAEWFQRKQAEEIGAPGSEWRRRHDESVALLATAYWEIEDAMTAVWEAHWCEHDGCYWCGDVDGIRYFAARFVNIIEGELCGRLAEDAEAQRRRRQTAGAGPYHGCPVLRGQRALERAMADLRTVKNWYEAAQDDPSAWMGEGADYELWALGMFEGAYHADAHLHMNPAAKAEVLGGLLAEYHAGKLPMAGTAD